MNESRIYAIFVHMQAKIGQQYKDGEMNQMPSRHLIQNLLPNVE